MKKPEGQRPIHRSADLLIGKPSVHFVLPS